MFRLLFCIAALASSVFAANVSGHWAGTIEMGGGRVPLYLTLTEQDGKVSGSVGGINTAAVAIENAELRGDALSFQVKDNAGRLIDFKLTLKNGVLGGEATGGGQTSTVAVVQVFGGAGGSAPIPAIGPGPGVYRVGGGISPPVLVRKVEPDYTEEARKARYQGTVLLYAEIAPDGRATNIKVQRSLGLGLDEKAIEAVKQWVFKPGEKDGRPVTVAATIEVNFRL
jgi:TonB family protein